MRYRFHDLPLTVHSLALPRRRPGLHAMLTSCGHDRRREPPYDWHGLRRGEAEFVLLQHTLAGEGRLAFQGREQPVLPGQTLLLHFPHDNRYWLPAESASWEFVFVCANGRSVVQMWEELVAAVGPLVRLPEEAPALATVLEILREADAGNLGSPFRAAALAYRLAMELADALLPASAGDARPEPIRAAIRFARGHLADAIGVEQMAAAAGYTRAHFSRLFRATEGIPPGEFLRRLRMEQAAKLLRHTELTADAIAARCGYNDGSYFARVFREVMGTTPEGFRRSGMY